MYTQKKPIENAHIVRERDRRRFRELLAVFSLGLPIGLFLLLFTWQNLEVIRLGREVTRLQKIRKEIGEDNKRLQFELDRLTALDSVEKRAARLGLRTTPPSAIVMVNAREGSAREGARSVPPSAQIPRSARNDGAESP
ncbi:MAG TPA: hypothetical protein VNA04_03630 [Thermoanaerobaculia bacterium]|nr:hypothetical protein [Thermoanaerobaculia bacterium]